MANSNFKKQMDRAANRDFETVVIEQRLNRLFHTKVGRSDRYGLHASAIIASDNEFCYREQLLSLFFKRDTGKDLPTSLLRIFEQGNVIHQKWQQMFADAGYSKHVEKTHFIKRYDLCFTPDIETNWEDEPIVEIKSVNTYAYGKSDSHPSGEKQLNFYLVLSDKPWGFVLMEDKNTQDFKIKIVKKDVEKAQPYIDRLKRIQEMKQEFLEERVVPKRKCKDCDCKRAVECAMRSACFNIGAGRVKLPKELREASGYLAVD